MMRGYDGKMHPTHQKHYFASREQQFEASKLGMWLFLATEILLFGALFVAYGIFRIWYPDLYAAGSTQLDTILGATNTLVLLASSLTVALAIRSAQMDKRKHTVVFLLLTILCACGFMGIKYVEYTHKFHLGIFPGEHFVLNEGTETVQDLSTGSAAAVKLGNSQALRPRGAATGPGAYGQGGSLQESTEAHGEEAAQEEAAHGEESGHPVREGPIFSQRRAGIFFSLYYVMTGIHGIHVLIGIVLLSIIAWKAWRGTYSSVWYTPVENAGLYWHVVDVIWIFLFPLLDRKSVV